VTVPTIDFDSIPDDNGDVLPDGTYLCKLIEVLTGKSSNGNEMWNLTWAVQEGEHANRYIWDRMVFSPKAMSRVKLICSRLGLDTTGVKNLKPGDLKGRNAYVTIETENYESTKTGRTEQRNSVPFDGYGKIEPKPIDPKDIPF